VVVMSALENLAEPESQVEEPSTVLALQRIEVFHRRSPMRLSRSTHGHSVSNWNRSGYSVVISQVRTSSRAFGR